MLKPVADCSQIVVCNTCRHADGERHDSAGFTGGKQMVAALRSAAAADPRYACIAIEEMPCLFACGEFCTVQLRAPGKIGYVLGRFSPDADAARALLDYAVHYAESEHGQVPYALWPEGVKGHFIVRTPPPGFVVA